MKLPSYQKKSDRGLPIKSHTVQQVLHYVIKQAHSSPGMHIVLFITAGVSSMTCLAEQALHMKIVGRA